MSVLVVRRVVGDSMAPLLKPGQPIIGTGLFRHLKPRQVVIIKHDGIEKIKRITDVDAEHGRVFVMGDNLAHSTDSRHFGWVPVKTVRAIVLWPWV